MIVKWTGKCTHCAAEHDITVRSATSKYSRIVYAECLNCGVSDTLILTAKVLKS